MYKSVNNYNDLTFVVISNEELVLYAIESLHCHQVALHMRAYRTFKDVKGVTRKNGEEWLIKMADTEAHIPDVYEEVSV